MTQNAEHRAADRLVLDGAERREEFHRAKEPDRERREAVARVRFLIVDQDDRIDRSPGGETMVNLFVAVEEQ